MLGENKKRREIMTENINKRFPKKELNAWLRLHKQLNHYDWLSLLDKLKKLGFHQWSVSVVGQKEIGVYLETNPR